MRKNIYSKFIGNLRKIDVFLDRKVLSLLAFTDLPSFNVIERESNKVNNKN
jgi:ribosomal protein L20